MELNPTLQANASYTKVTAISADYTVTDTDEYCGVDVTTGASTITVTLPTLADNQGRILRMCKADAGGGKITVDGEGAETINGSTTEDVTSQYDCLAIQAMPTEWRII